MVPSSRLREEADKRRALETRNADLTSKIAELTDGLTKATTSISSMQTAHGQDLHLIGLGFQAQSVQRFFRNEYASAMHTVAKDDRPAFGDWLDANKADPLYAPHFGRVSKASESTTSATAAADKLAALTALLEGDDDDDAKAEAVFAALRGDAPQPEQTPAEKALAALQELLGGGSGDQKRKPNGDPTSGRGQPPRSHERKLDFAKLSKKYGYNPRAGRGWKVFPKGIRDQLMAQMADE